MKTEWPLYLSSLDSARLEAVREVRKVKYLEFDTGKMAMRAIVRPGVPVQDFSVVEDVDTVMLTARHAGTSVDRIEEFPFFVFVAIPRAGVIKLESPIRQDDLQVIGWGELYRSTDDAEHHRFD